MEKHSYKATFKNHMGEEFTITRTSTNDYKFFWMVEGYLYGYNTGDDGQRKEYNILWDETGFTSKPRIGRLNRHKKADFDEVGKRGLQKRPFERHQRIINTVLVPVEIVK